MVLRGKLEVMVPKNDMKDGRKERNGDARFVKLN